MLFRSYRLARLLGRWKEASKLNGEEDYNVFFTVKWWKGFLRDVLQDSTRISSLKEYVMLRELSLCAATEINLLNGNYDEYDSWLESLSAGEKRHLENVYSLQWPNPRKPGGVYEFQLERNWFDMMPYAASWVPYFNSFQAAWKTLLHGDASFQPNTDKQGVFPPSDEIGRAHV